MKKCWICLICLCILLTGCNRSSHGLNKKKPVTLTMWHNFGGTMQKTMDTLIDEFNSTLGKDTGIIINVTAISSSEDLQETLSMIVNEDPGAPAMPDIATCYPKTAIHFYEKNLLADIESYFSKDEIEAYVPEFVKEGRMEDGGLYVFPFAKSTEILYLNQTLFDEFSNATGVTMEYLNTFEGIAKASQIYYEWTDEMTPEIDNDGKAFFAADSWLNIAQTGMKQLSAMLFQEEEFDFMSEEYQRIWNLCYTPSLKGGFALYEGYSSDLAKTGDLVCSTGSSAGILFYGDTITYPDNTIRQVEYSILPYPIFEDSEKYAIQRGNGMMVAKSNETKEYAASLFLKWFTQPEQNMRFISETGYLPVTKEAFEDRMSDEISQVTDERIKKMLQTVTDMYYNYSFYTTPTFVNFDAISKSYENEYFEFMTSQRDLWKKETNNLDIYASADDALKQWIEVMSKE